MLSLLGILVVFNLFSIWRNKLTQPVSQIELCIALLVDVGKALAAYQETIATRRTSFDDFRDALSGSDFSSIKKYPEAAQRGLRIFVGRGNCYACHQMTKQEVSYGTLGPTLLGYGKLRNFGTAETKAAYEKIYNSQAALACSNMPRFGANKILDIEQIKDLAG